MTFDIRAEFPVKREQRPEGNYRLSEGHYLDVKVGDIVPLSGIIDASKKSLVDFYTWESRDGTILKNQLNDEIQYWDEENRENDYVPQAVGREFLNFVVTDIHGVKHSKTLLLKVRSKDANQDDHGNSIATATTIELNKKVDGVFENQSDKDFFKFTLDKKQNVKLGYSRFRKVGLLDSEGKTLHFKYLSVPGSSLYRTTPIKLESGTYYIRTGGHVGKYTLEVIAYDDNPIDKYPEHPATKVSPGTVIKSYINSKNDKDCFYKKNAKYKIEGDVRSELKSRNSTVCLKLSTFSRGRTPYTISFFN
jgi:hypothetical protein